jgi:hypothetical protein
LSFVRAYPGSLEEGMELVREGVSDDTNNYSRIKIALDIAFGDIAEISHVSAIFLVELLGARL